VNSHAHMSLNFDSLDSVLFSGIDNGIYTPTIVEIGFS
jgi:hypothetical protein